MDDMLEKKNQQGKKYKNTANCNSRIALVIDGVHNEYNNIWSFLAVKSIGERKGGENIALGKIRCWGIHGMSVAICG